MNNDNYVSIHPDGHHILSATDKKVILLGYYSTEENYDPCVLYITRKLYHNAIDSWLDHKADYNQRYDGDFCGVGVIYFENIKELPHGAHLAKCIVEDASEWDPDDGSINWGGQGGVKIFKASTFSVDMEHG